MRSDTERLFTSVALLLGLGLSSAHAQPGGSEAASAQSLYDEALRLYEAGSYEQACPKFEASYHLNPQDLDARGLLALCYEKIGRLATAWSHFREIRVKAVRPAQAKVAEDHIKALEPQLAHLTLQVTATLPGFVLKENGVIVSAVSFGIALAIDKGRHTIVAEAPGHVAWSRELTIEDRESKVVEVPALAPSPVRAVPDDKTATPLPEVASSTGLSTRHWFALSTAGAGVVVLGIGGVIGLSAKSSRDEARDLGCSDDLATCPPNALKTADDAYSKGKLATGFLFGAAVFVAAGAVLWVTAPKRSSSAERTSWRLAPSLGPGHAQADLVFSF